MFYTRTNCRLSFWKITLWLNVISAPNTELPYARYDNLVCLDPRHWRIAAKWPTYIRHTNTAYSTRFTFTLNKSPQMLSTNKYAVEYVMESVECLKSSIKNVNLLKRNSFVIYIFPLPFLCHILCQFFDLIFYQCFSKLVFNVIFGLEFCPAIYGSIYIPNHFYSIVKLKFPSITPKYKSMTE